MRKKKYDIITAPSFRDDAAALKYLEDRGWNYTSTHGFTRGDKRKATKDELAAIEYLMIEWDFGDLQDLPEPINRGKARMRKM